MCSKISFQKATKSHKEIIFSWLNEPHVREFWDNTQEHKDDIISLINGRKTPSTYCNGKYTYWIASINDHPYAMLMSIQETHEDDIGDLKLSHLSQTGHTYGIDYMIGDKAYIGKGYGAQTLDKFIYFLGDEFDKKADTFLIDPTVDNPRAKKVYEKTGFQHVGDFLMEGDVSGKGQMHHLLVKKLTPFHIEQKKLESSILETLQTHYSLNVSQLIQLQLGADNNAQVYKAISSELSSFFVKVRTTSQDTIGGLTPATLSDLGVEHLIAPIPNAQGNITQNTENFNLTVYPFIEGQDGFTKKLTSEQWHTLGKTLRNIHNLEIPPFISKQITREIFSPKWRSKVRNIYSDLNSKIAQDRIASNFISLLQTRQDTILRLVNHAEVLADKLKRQQLEFVFCHSDIHAGNVLIANTGDLYIVDWDAPILAPKERDLMFIGGGVANVWNQVEEEELFYTGYGTTSFNQGAIAYYRNERIVEDIAIYYQSLLFEVHAENDREIMYKHFLDMFEKNGVVDIAFSSTSI